jgi:hypothetical protein
VVSLRHQAGRPHRHGARGERVSPRARPALHSPLVTWLHRIGVALARHVFVVMLHSSGR